MESPDQIKKTLPLNAFSYRELNKKAWSNGKTHGTYERRERRNALPPTEEMTLDQLVRTQFVEPDTESRRSFYANGNGVLSLDALPVDHDAARYGTPYEQLDPITAKQIAWEQKAFYTGPCVTARLVDGRVVADRYTDRRTFNHLRTVLRSLPAPQPKVRLTREAFREAKKRAAAVCNDEVRRQTALADPIFHCAYERTHKGEVVATVTAGPRRRDTWHARAIDMTELEIGFDLASDDEIESLLGANE